MSGAESGRRPYVVRILGKRPMGVSKKRCANVELCIEIVPYVLALSPGQCWRGGIVE